MNLNTLNTESLSLIRIRSRSRIRIRSRTRILVLVLVHSFSCLVAFIVVMRLGRVDGFFSALGAGGGNVDRPKMTKMLRMRMMMKMRRKMGRVPCKCNSSSSRGYRGGTISAINMRICIWEIRAALPPHSQFLFLLLLPLPLPSSSLWHFTCCAVKQKMVMS